MNRRFATVWIGVALLVAFVVLGLLVREEPPTLDAVIAESLRDQWQSPLGRVAVVLSDAFGPVLAVVLAVMLLVGALRRWLGGDRERAALLLRAALVLVLCRATSIVGKPLFGRDRPREYPFLSYPSGHVVAVASVGFVLVLLCRLLAPRLLRAVITAAVLATLISATFRVYLGVHWLTDTAGAVLAVTGVGLLASSALGLLPAGRDPVSSRRETA